MRAMPLAPLVLLGLSFAGTRPARAAPTARLVYSRTAGAASCPDEGALRRAVSVRVGYDPFFGWARKTIIANMSASPSRGFVARVMLVDEDGIAHGARELRTSGACAERLDPVALGIAIAIDPHALARLVDNSGDQTGSSTPADSDTQAAGTQSMPSRPAGENSAPPVPPSSPPRIPR